MNAGNGGTPGMPGGAPGGVPLGPGGVPDLGALKAGGDLPAVLGDDMMAEVRAAGEAQSGMRCVACGERIEEGWAYHTIAPTLREGQPTIVHSTLSVCTRDECNGNRTLLREPSMIVREKLTFEWLPEKVEDRDIPPEAGAKPDIATP